MNNSTEQRQEAEVVSCNICHREVPYAESLAAEAQEYLFHFCGLGCYTTWEQMSGGAVVSGA